MSKEQLIALGLTEEQADKVIAGYGQMVPKSRLDEKIQEAKDLKEQLTDRDTQLADLKKSVGDNEDLKKQIEQLQADNKTKDEEYQAKMKELSLNAALKLSLSNDVHDSDLVLSLIDKEKIELAEDGSIKAGLDDQVKALRESKAFLFVEKQEEKPPAFKGFTPPDGKKDDGKDKDKSEDFGKSLAQFATGNADLEKARDSYFG